MDAVTTSGYIEGWAFDSSAPFRPLTVGVRADGKTVAQGVANRYRWDLADAGCGTGWCAFRLKLCGRPSRMRRANLSLWDMPQQIEIHQVGTLPLAPDVEPVLSILDEIVAADPTRVGSIEQLRGCGSAFSEFIASRGVTEFVRAAYVYVLGRPADESGLASYAAMVGDGSLSPYGMLRALYDSEEFRSSPGPLIAPTESGFVFQTL